MDIGEILSILPLIQFIGKNYDFFFFFWFGHKHAVKNSCHEFDKNDPKDLSTNVFKLVFWTNILTASPSEWAWDSCTWVRSHALSPHTPFLILSFHLAFLQRKQCDSEAKEQHCIRKNVSYMMLLFTLFTKLSFFCHKQPEEEKDKEDKIECDKT